MIWSADPAKIMINEVLRRRDCGIRSNEVDLGGVLRAALLLWTMVEIHVLRSHTESSTTPL